MTCLFYPKISDSSDGWLGHLAGVRGAAAKRSNRSASGLPGAATGPGTSSKSNRSTCYAFTPAAPKSMSDTSLSRGPRAIDSMLAETGICRCGFALIRRTALPLKASESQSLMRSRTAGNAWSTFRRSYVTCDDSKKIIPQPNAVVGERSANLKFENYIHSLHFQNGMMHQ
jgi:hypothetical protein